MWPSWSWFRWDDTPDKFLAYRNLKVNVGHDLLVTITKKDGGVGQEMSLEGSSLRACADACNGDPKCRGFEYKRDSHTCFFKGDLPCGENSERVMRLLPAREDNAVTYLKSL
jgi:hypothetical protein